MSADGMHHVWLSLIEISGPFLAVPVLKEAFPQGVGIPEELPLAFVAEWLTMVIYFGVAALWLLPDKRLEAISGE